MRNIKDLIKKQVEKKKEKTTDEIFESIIKADMELMLRHGRNGRNVDFPDPVEPQWKN